MTRPLLPMLCIVASTAAVQAQPVRSGVYEGLILAVASDGRAAARIDFEQETGPPRRCTVDVVGKVVNGTVAIRPTGPTKAMGSISPGPGGGITLRLPGLRSMPGCGLVVPPEVEGAGLDLDLVQTGSWTNLASVASDRSPLRPAPNARPGGAYLIRGDVVAVAERQGRMTRIVHRAPSGRVTRAWIPTRDLSIR